MQQPTSVVGKRIGAFLIDYVLYLIVFFAVFFAMADTDRDIAQQLIQREVDPNTSTYGNITIGDTKYSIVGSKFLLYLLIIFLFGFLYYAVLQGIKGWTLGKLAVGIRTVDEQGNFPGVGRGTVRWLGLVFIDSAPWLIPYILGFVMILATKQKRRVGDFMAKTAVVGKEFVGQPPYPQQAGYGVPAPGYAPQPAQPAQAAAVGAGAQPAGWYADPQGQARLRYWDGAAWTEHTSA
jgi:uncharacterized RDD family membrane protein YckC